MYIAIIAFSLIIMGQLFPVNLPESYPIGVKQAIKKAGINWRELVRVIEHYEKAGDSQKLNAAYYLIGNMEGHGYVAYSLHDNDGNEVEFDPLNYRDYKAAREAIKQLEEGVGEVSYKGNLSYRDLKTVTFNYLIDNIELAFAAWQERPWARGVPLEIFLEYVLPYRGTNEPLENWRPYFIKRYRNLPTEMKHPDDFLEAATLINTDLKSLIAFDEIFYLHPTDQGLKEMLTTKKGRCEDLSNLAIYAMRANGLPVTTDYTPSWPDRGNNHMWNVLITHGGSSVPFMGGLENPGEYRLTPLMAKAYRNTFSLQRDSLAFKKGEHEEVPAWLSGKHFIDVTHLYTEVSDVAIQITMAQVDEGMHVYLSVFNAGEWKAVQWAEIKDGRAVFKDMGRNIVYQPMFYKNGKLISAADPFVLDKSGAVFGLGAGSGNTTKVILTSIVPSDNTTTNSKSLLEKGKEYQLFYWKDEWILVGKKTATDAPLEFQGVPEGGLYWATSSDRDSKETARIFTLANGVVRWW